MKILRSSMVMTAIIFASIAVMGPVFLTHVQAATQITGCPNISRNLSFGMNGADVQSLQQYFIQQDVLGSGYATGFFGTRTRAAAIQFQEANDLPAFGFVGSLTRAVITHECSTSNGSGGTASSTSPVSIYSITPSSGAMGSIVTIKGSGFTNDNIIHFGAGSIAHATSTTLTFDCPVMLVGSPTTCGKFFNTITFTVPSVVGPYCAPGMACPMYMMLVTPGTYPVSVQNANGTSTSTPFIVTGSSTTLMSR